MEQEGPSSSSTGAQRGWRKALYQFTQQNLPACKPVLTPKWVISSFFIIGIIFIPMGFLFLHASKSVVEIVDRYDTECIPVPFRNTRVAYVEDDSVPKNCTRYLKVPRHMKAPIYIYYQLDNYYQNHRRYVKSRSDQQLLHGLRYNSTGTCKPEDTNNGLPIVPCGLVAWSLFNDTYDFSRGVDELKVNRKNIAWRSDRDHKFGKHVYPFNFQNGSLIGGAKLDPGIPASSADMAVPGCPEKCGNLVIPYPFGIGKGCYFDDEFEVKCNESTRAASLSLAGGLINIYNISTEYVGVESVNLPFLLNQSTGENLDGFLIGDTLLASMHYNFSYTRNKLLAVGCDVFAYVKDRTTGEIISECASFCRHGPEHVQGPAPMKSCLGDGCCESLNISRPMTNFSAMMYTMNTFDKSWKGRGCSFLFIVDKEFSDYGRINGSDCNQNYELPLVLDWTISNMSCNEGGTICGLNSECVNHSGRRGYSCHCKKGYEGNPYLSSGCQDINECEGRDATSHKCPKNTHCVNTPGGYSCKCLSGYHVTADGCILDQHRRTWILYLCLGIGLSIGFLAMIVLGFWLHKLLKRRKQAKVKKQFFTKNGGLLLLEQQISFNKGSVADTQVFTIEELEKATDNFHSGRILGKGGLGTVYKGMLPDGTILALKKPNELDEKQINQFINEIFILSQINHRNIVKVLGCCLEVQIPMVVYEYVPNGNLSYYLHGRGTTAQKRSLSWMDRLRIAAEVAGALAYLHSCASMAIFHRDVKSSNILLDENFRAVVSDFGLSRSVPVDKTHVTTTVGGTFGYLDPEYFRSGQLNDKSDVYGFGVVLAELLTGRKVIPTEKHEECLVSRFVSLTKQDRAVEILDKIVVEEGEEGKSWPWLRLPRDV